MPFTAGYHFVSHKVTITGLFSFPRLSCQFDAIFSVNMIPIYSSNEIGLLIQRTLTVSCVLPLMVTVAYLVAMNDQLAQSQ